MSWLLCCKASFAPYLPQKQNPGVSFRTVFFMILFYNVFKNIYLDSFIRTFFSYAPATERTVFTFSLWTAVLFCYCIYCSIKPVQRKCFSSGTDEFVILFIILKILPLCASCERRSARFLSVERQAWPAEYCFDRYIKWTSGAWWEVWASPSAEYAAFNGADRWWKIRNHWKRV